MQQVETPWERWWVLQMCKFACATTFSQICKAHTQTFPVSNRKSHSWVNCQNQQHWFQKDLFMTFSLFGATCYQLKRFYYTWKQTANSMHNPMILNANTSSIQENESCDLLWLYQFKNKQTKPCTLPRKKYSCFKLEERILQMRSSSSVTSKFHA